MQTPWARLLRPRGSLHPENNNHRASA